jgi:hypothetical protein
LNAVLAAKNYRLNGVEGEEGDINVNLAGNETKRVDFLLHDDATGLNVTKGMVFSADRYNVGLAIDLKRAGQTLPAKSSSGRASAIKAFHITAFILLLPKASRMSTTVFSVFLLRQFIQVKKAGCGSLQSVPKARILRK